jgi:hypothetical protein
MNAIKISGQVVGEPKVHEMGDGESAKALSLQFHRGQGTVTLFAVAQSVTETLAKFRPGDHVEVWGQLTINPTNGRCAVLTEYITGNRRLDGWATRTGEIEAFEATRSHRQNARIAGIGTSNRRAMR